MEKNTVIRHETYSVSRVGDDSADHTSQVTGGEGDAELGALGVALLGGGEHVGVESLHDLLEEEELSHGVGDLSAPQGHQAAEGEPAQSHTNREYMGKPRRSKAKTR